MTRRLLLLIGLLLSSLLLLSVVRMEGDDIINPRRIAFASSGNYTDLPTSGTARRLVAVGQSGFTNFAYWGTGSRFVQMGAQPHYVLQKRFIIDYPIFQATTGPANIGGTAYTVTDAATATTDNTDTARFCRRSVTTAGATTSSLDAAATSISGSRLGYGPKFVIRVIGATSLASVRYWVGLTSATLGAVDSDSALNYAMFRYSTVASDTRWAACTSDGTTASCTAGIAGWGSFPDSANSHTLEIDCSDTATPACIFMVDGLPLQKTTNLPVSTTNLGIQFSVENTAGAAEGLSFCGSQLETN